RDRDVLRRINTRPRETRPGGASGEPGPVLDRVQSLLLDGERELAVDEQSRGRVTMERVDAEDIHPRSGSIALRNLDLNASNENTSVTRSDPARPNRSRMARSFSNVTIA